MKSSKLNCIDGFSLISMSISLGVIGVVMMGFIAMTMNMSKSLGRLEEKDSINQLVTKAQLILSDTMDCTASLGGQTINTNSPAVIIYDPAFPGDINKAILKSGLVVRNSIIEKVSLSDLITLPSAKVFANIKIEILTKDITLRPKTIPLIVEITPPDIVLNCRSGQSTPLEVEQILGICSAGQVVVGITSSGVICANGFDTSSTPGGCTGGGCVALDQGDCIGQGCQTNGFFCDGPGCNAVGVGATCSGNGCCAGPPCCQGAGGAALAVCH